MKLLLVVDMQNDFISGSLGSKEAQAIVPNVVNKIKEYKNNEDAIMLTQDTHQENYLRTQEGINLPIPHCIVNTWGWEIADKIKEVTSNYQVFSKQTFSLDFNGLMLNYLDSIEIVGLCTDICVVSNALNIKAKFPEVPIYVDASCCAGTTPKRHKEALDVMESCQIHIINNNKNNKDSKYYQFTMSDMFKKKPEEKVPGLEYTYM